MENRLNALSNPLTTSMLFQPHEDYLPLNKSDSNLNKKIDKELVKYEAVKCIADKEISRQIEERKLVHNEHLDISIQKLSADLKNFDPITHKNFQEIADKIIYGIGGAIKTVEKDNLSYNQAASSLGNNDVKQSFLEKQKNHQARALKEKRAVDEYVKIANSRIEELRKERERKILEKALIHHSYIGFGGVKKEDKGIINNFFNTFMITCKQGYGMQHRLTEVENEYKKLQHNATTDHRPVKSSNADNVEAYFDAHRNLLSDISDLSNVLSEKEDIMHQKLSGIIKESILPSDFKQFEDLSQIYLEIRIAKEKKLDDLIKTCDEGDVTLEELEPKIEKIQDLWKKIEDNYAVITHQGDLIIDIVSLTDELAAFREENLIFNPALNEVKGGFSPQYAYDYHKKQHEAFLAQIKVFEDKKNARLSEIKQQLEIKVHPETIQVLKNERNLINSRWDSLEKRKNQNIALLEERHSTFQLLNQPENVSKKDLIQEMDELLNKTLLKKIFDALNRTLKFKQYLIRSNETLYTLDMEKKRIVNMNSISRLENIRKENQEIANLKKVRDEELEKEITLFQHHLNEMQTSIKTITDTFASLNNQMEICDKWNVNRNNIKEAKQSGGWLSYVTAWSFGTSSSQHAPKDVLSEESSLSNVKIFEPSNQENEHLEIKTKEDSIQITEESQGTNEELDNPTPNNTPRPNKLFDLEDVDFFGENSLYEKKSKINLKSSSNLNLDTLFNW